jgi:hypothetical protein
VVWVILDVFLVLLSFVMLGVILLGLWRKVKDLGREVGRAGDAIGRATQDLADLQAELPPRA